MIDTREGFPGAALLPTLDVGEAPLRHVLRGEVGLLPPEDHVVELGLLRVVGGDPDGGDVDPGCGCAQFGRCDEASDEDHPVHGCALRGALGLRSLRGLGSGLGAAGVGLAGHWTYPLFGGSMQRCHPDQVPSGIPLAAGDTPLGLQRTGSGLVAVCDEIHDKRVGHQDSGSSPKHRHDRHGRQRLGKPVVSAEPRRAHQRPASTTEVKVGTPYRRSGTLTDGPDAPSMRASRLGGHGCKGEIRSRLWGLSSTLLLVERAALDCRGPS